MKPKTLALELHRIGGDIEEVPAYDVALAKLLSTNGKSTGAEVRELTERLFRQGNEGDVRFVAICRSATDATVDTFEFVSRLENRLTYRQVP